MKPLIELTELESAVQISLTSRARSKNQNGYWGDLIGPVNCGSLLWTLDREYLSPEAEQLAKQYADDALSFLKKGGFVQKIKTDVNRKNGVMKIYAEIDHRGQDVSL